MVVQYKVFCIVTDENFELDKHVKKIFNLWLFYLENNDR